MARWYETEEEWRAEEFRTAPGLFTTSPEWVRFEEYEIVERERNLYVVPRKGAKMERYRPFEHYYKDKSILLEFLILAYQLKMVSEREREAGKFDPRNQQYRARLICRFASKYGLLGLFWKNAYAIERRIHKREGQTFYIVKPNLEIWNRLRSLGDLELYDDYAAAYFPRLGPPYPNCYTAEEEFWTEYGEAATEVMLAAAYMREHAQKVGEFKEQKPYPGSLKDRIPSPQVDNLKLDLEYDGQVWQLSWKFASLLDALWIMQLLNTVEQKDQVRICAFPPCRRPFIGRRRFCSDSCGNNYRQWKKRGKLQQPVQQPDRESKGQSGINRKIKKLGS